MSMLKNIPALGDRLKYIRETRGLSQMELAEIAGTTQQAIQQAESGKAQNPRYLHRLALALDIPSEWLTMNVLPDKKGGNLSGFSERNEVLDNFYAMPKKDQALLLELKKKGARKTSKPARVHRPACDPYLFLFRINPRKRGHYDPYP